MVDNEIRFQGKKSEQESGVSEKGMEWLATKFRINVHDVPPLYLGLLIDEALEKGTITNGDLDILNQGSIPDESNNS